MKGIIVFVIVLAVLIGAFSSKGHSKQATSTDAAATGRDTSPHASVSSCRLHGKTILAGIPSDASQFRFKFIGGGFTGHSWHTDWLPNDSSVKNGTFWIYTLADGGATPSGVTGELQMTDGHTTTTDLQECY